MPTVTRALPALLFLALPLGACSIDVSDSESNHHGKNVDIRTLAGDVSVKTNVDAAGTGLPVYPGARPARSQDDHESANVNIGTPWFGLKVAAAKFESDAAPQQVLDYYKSEMKQYGAVMECRGGDIDFKGKSGAKQPVCKEKPSSRDVELMTGTEARQRIVAVKPLASGTEFSLVYVETRGDQ